MNIQSSHRKMSPEHFWTGSFGREYTDRNAHTWNDLDDWYIKLFGVKRTELNQEFLGDLPRDLSILEIGTNIGTQLHLLDTMGFMSLHGVELQVYAVEQARSNLPQADIRQGSATTIPFPDKEFDLVFTSGVLIHIQPLDIPRVVQEMLRCTRRYIWGCEYYADFPTEVPYRNRDGLMWKRNFAQLFLDTEPRLTSIKRRKISYLDNDCTDEMYLLALSCPP